MSADAPDGPAVLRAALERLPVAVLIVGAHDTIALVNSAAEHLFGYARAELIGQTIHLLVPRDRWSPHAGLDPAAPDPRGAAHSYEFSARRKDGSEVPVRAHVAPITVGDSTFAVVSVSDNTERHRLEGELWAFRDGRLQFEMLVGELGAEFVNLRADDVDRAIDDALGRVGRLLDLEQAVLFQILENGDFVVTHQWTRPGWTVPAPRIAGSEHLPWHLAQLRAGQAAIVPALEDIPDAADRITLQRFGVRSMITIPLPAGGRTSAVAFAAARQSRAWATEAIARLRVVALICANGLARKRTDDALRETIAIGAAARERLRQENAYLRREVQRITGVSTLVGHSLAMRRVFEQVRQAATSDAPVLLLGETGTGKSLIATRIHELSARSPRALVRLRCAGLTAAALDRDVPRAADAAGSEADPFQSGAFALAHHSTIYLDEVADLPQGTQARLLRLLQDGGPHQPEPKQIDVRVIAATRKDLMRCMEQGTFRQELYLLLSERAIRLPPLRDRPEDIPLLVWRFVDEFSELYGKPIDTIDTATMASLQRYTWPGNATELRTVIERAVIVGTTRQLRIPLAGGAEAAIDTLAAVERQHITAALIECEWQVGGKEGAAARLGITPRALSIRMARLGIPRRPS